MLAIRSQVRRFSTQTILSSNAAAQELPAIAEKQTHTSGDNDQFFLLPFSSKMLFMGVFITNKTA
jgi:hypothetical protein